MDGKPTTIRSLYFPEVAPGNLLAVANAVDHGKTWKDVLTVYEYDKNTKGKQNAGMNDVWSEMAAFAVGHPYMKRMQEGSLWVYFYSGPSTHRTDLHYVQIEV